MRKIIGFVSAIVVFGLVMLILMSITMAIFLGRDFLDDNLIHWFGQIAIFFCIIATWAFWEI